MRKSKFLFLLAATIITLSLLMVAGCKSEEPAVTKPTIKLIKADWSSQILCTELINQIIQKELGYKTEQVLMSVSMGWPAMAKGDIDIAAEIWLPGRQNEIQPFLDNGSVELTGQIFPGGAGWVTQRWVVEGDAERGIAPLAPDLKSILDLQDVSKGGKGYWKLFENPEKPGLGEVVYGSPGWVVEDLWMFLGYDLPLWESYQSENVMMARMIAADQKKQPLLMSIWWPHWIFSEVDLIILEEPDAYDPSINYDVAPYPLKTGHQKYDIQKVVRTDLKTRAPDVYALMQKITLSEAEIGELMLRVDSNGEDPVEVVLDWMDKNQAKINQWLGK